MKAGIENLKAIKTSEIVGYEGSCIFECINRTEPEDTMPLQITADELTEEELNKVSFGEPRKWSVLVSDRMNKAAKESDSNSFYIMRKILCRLHNHDHLSADDYVVIDSLIDEHNKKQLLTV